VILADFDFRENILGSLVAWAELIGSFWKVLLFHFGSPPFHALSVFESHILKSIQVIVIPFGVLLVRLTMVHIPNLHFLPPRRRHACLHAVIEVSPLSPDASPPKGRESGRETMKVSKDGNGVGGS